MKVVLLDRDGTVIVEPPSFSVKLDQVELFPDTIPALKKLAAAGFNVIFVTNQLSIATGDLSVEEYEATNQKMLDLLKPSGVKVLKIYMCPHGPDDNCDCRKPKPGMLLQAARDFDLDLSETFMIGDRVTDVEAGRAAGTKTVLIPQGNFKDVTDKADYVASGLLDAAEYIVAH